MLAPCRRGDMNTHLDSRTFDLSTQTTGQRPWLTERSLLGTPSAPVRVRFHSQDQLDGSGSTRSHGEVVVADGRSVAEAALHSQLLASAYRAEFRPERLIHLLERRNDRGVAVATQGAGTTVVGGIRRASQIATRLSVLP